MATAPDQMPDPAWAAGVLEGRIPVVIDATDPVHTPSYPTKAHARAAADNTLEGTREPIVLFCLADSSGYVWATADQVQDVNGWAQLVRTPDGVWLEFHQPDAALEFLRVERAIAAVRDELLSAVTDLDETSTRVAAELAAVLDTLRSERSALLPRRYR